MTDADDCPFDGEVPAVPAAARAPRVAAPKAKSESVLDEIIQTPYESLSFNDFAKLKSGRDVYSGMKAPALRDAISEVDRSSIVEAFQQDETSQTSCMRWMLRGLDCKKAIRKVQTDSEISKKAISKWKG
jgi:hypothetical protein